jgi:hypothetical protein
MNPVIEYFPVSGTWTKPPGAIRVDIVLAGGDGGNAMEFDGESLGGECGGNSGIGYVPNPNAVASFTSVRSSESAGDPGTLSVMSYAAADLPEALEVEVGKGGRPGGRDGYALLVTHLTEEPESDLSLMVARPRARAAESAIDAALAIRAGDIGEARGLLREAEFELDLAERRAGEAAPR